MRLNEFNQQITEVPMNPGEFAKGVEAGGQKGVLVGFEFEVCVPAASTMGGMGANEQEWYHKVPEDWYSDNGGNIDSLSYALRFVKPIEYKGKTFKGEQLEELFHHWASIKIGKKIKKIFEAMPKASKKKLMKAWKEYLSHYDESDNVNNIYTFAVRARYVLNYADENRAAIQKAINSLSNKQFWIDVFGTISFPDLVNNPALEWLASEVEEHFDMNDNYYGSDYYRPAAKLLQPVLQKAFGKVIVFDEYHERDKDTKSWYIEPDGSLKPNDGDSSAEVVTPPLPAPQAIQALKTFYAIAKSLNLYTSAENSTGLHINVSIPDKLDVLKLAVFVGDEYVLKAWGREENGYVESVIKDLRRKYQSDRYEYNDEKDQNEITPYNPSNQKHYKQLLQIAKDTSDEHIASVSFNGKYVSFRHAGGNYLQDQQSVINVVGRFVRAMIIASDPNAYRKEYLTKLTKLVAPKSAPVQQTALSSIMAFKTKPIPVMLTGLYATKPTSKINNMIARNKDTDSWIVPPTIETKSVLDKLLADPQNHIWNSAWLKIKSVPQTRQLLIRVNNETRPYHFNDNIGWDGPDYVIKKSDVVQPGTPLHELVYSGMIQELKKKIKK